MDVFKDYAYYCDLFYKDRDYAGEAKKIDYLINQYQQSSHVHILNLGCGTGKHDYELSKLGYQLTGIDLSADMIRIARENLLNEKASIEFEAADVRSYNTPKKYDAVISLFHVMSYQNDNSDVLKTLNTARNALKDKGLFVFDAWYGSGVLTDKPCVRVKHAEDDNSIAIRYANPIMHANTNIVDVNYSVVIINKENGVARKINETHKMRYFFVPEIKYMLENCGFELLDCLDCESLREAGFSSWITYFIARKKRRNRIIHNILYL